MVKHTKRMALFAALILGVFFITGAGVAPAEQPLGSHSWAESINKPGLPNLFRVDGCLYRGAQPESTGFKELEAMGIKTVIDLRWSHSEEAFMAQTKMSYVRIPLNAWKTSEKDIAQFLRVVMDPEKTPVFIHCLKGADRTGVMCAAYRTVVCGWTKEEAIREMKNGGFHFHNIWWNLIKVIEGLDVEAMRAKVGIKEIPDTRTCAPCASS